MHRPRVRLFVGGALVAALGLVLSGCGSTPLQGAGGGGAGGGPVPSSGTFAAATAFSTDSATVTGTKPYAVAVGDLNRDGHPDVITADDNSPGTVSVLLGTGKGTFGKAATYATGGTAPQSVALADVNGDGKLDVVVANAGSNTVSVLLGDGKGGLGSATTYGVNGTAPTGVAVKDVNGDGHPDIVTANNASATVSVLLNDGSGSFPSGSGVPTYSTSTLINGGLVGTYPHSVALHDLNGDGHPDIVTADDHHQNMVSVLLNTGSGAFQSVTVYPDGTANPESAAVADVTGDGHPDVITANNYIGSITILPGTATGALGPDDEIIGNLNPWGIAAADLNGDGKPDVVTADFNNPGFVAVWLNPGSGKSWGPEKDYPLAASTYPKAVAVADLNGDGIPDLVVADNNTQAPGTISVLLGKK